MTIMIKSEKNNAIYNFVSVKFNRLNYEGYFDVAKALLNDTQFLYYDKVLCKLIDRELGRNVTGSSTEIINYLIEFGSKVLHFVTDDEVA